MSVTLVNTAVVKCVRMSQAATNALVRMGIHSYLIIQLVKVRKKESFYLLLRK